MGRPDWPIKKEWSRVPLQWKRARCRHCGVRIDFRRLAVPEDLGSVVIGVRV